MTLKWTETPGCRRHNERLLKRSCSRGIDAVYHGLTKGQTYDVEAEIENHGDAWFVTYVWKPRAAQTAGSTADQSIRDTQRPRTQASACECR
jgi:hypothetical protein